MIMRLNRVSLLFFLIIIPLASVWANALISYDPKATWQLYVSKNWTWCIEQSEDGKILWVGIWGALQKRDAKTGALIKEYTSLDGLPSNDVNAILDDGDGGAWVGTGRYADLGGGLVHISSEGIFRVFTTNNSQLPSNMVTALQSDGTGGIWIATYEGGVVHLDADLQWAIYNEENSDLPDNYVNTLLSDENGGLWIGTGWLGLGTMRGGSGLAYLEPNGEWSIFNTSNSDLPNNRITAIESDGYDGIWIGTGFQDSNYHGGLAHLYPNGKWTIYTTDNSGLPFNTIRALYPDQKEGGIWVGTGYGNDAGGLAYLSENGEWHIFSTIDSTLPIPQDWNWGNTHDFDWINGMVDDGTGGMWAATGGGLLHINNILGLIADGDVELRIFNNDTSALPHNYVYCIESDGDDGLWIGTFYDGLVHVDRYGKKSLYTTDNSSLPHNRILYLSHDTDEGVFIVTEGGYQSVLSHLDGEGNWKHYRFDHSNFPAEKIYDIGFDGESGLWIGSEVGLIHMDQDGNWRVFNSENSTLKSNEIRKITIGEKGNIWVGSSAELVCFDPDAPEGLCRSENSNTPLHMIDISTAPPEFRGVSEFVEGNYDNDLYIGTTNGLLRFDSRAEERDAWTFFTVDNSPLPSNDVYVMEINDADELFLGTMEKGLVHRRKDGTWAVYDKLNSGLPDNKLYGAQEGEGMLLDNSGGLWVAVFDNGLSHLTLFGSPEQLFPEESDIHLTWFLNRTVVETLDVVYIELQRALSRSGHFETVRDASGNPIRFDVDDTQCPDPLGENCWPAIQGHTPETRLSPSGRRQTRGYRLDRPVVDIEWLEGVPRYYRLSAVCRKDGGLIRAANFQESVLVTPGVQEKPRIHITPDRSAVAIAPGDETEISLFLTSLDLFSGSVLLEVKNGTDSVDHGAGTGTISTRVTPERLGLKPGETVSALLHVEVTPGAASAPLAEIPFHIIPKSDSGQSGQPAVVKVNIGGTQLLSIGVSERENRYKIGDTITFYGNIVPAEGEKEIFVSINGLERAMDNATVVPPLSINDARISDASSSGNAAYQPIRVYTDARGNFEGTVTTTTTGPFTLSARADGMTSETDTLFIQPANRHIALTSNVTQDTWPGDTIRIHGTVSPMSVHTHHTMLDIRYLDPADPTETERPQFVGEVTLSASGTFEKEIVVPGKGFIDVKATLPETSDYLGIETTLVIPIGQPVGEGIILVSASGTPAFCEISKSLGSYVYHTLKNRNIPEDRIRYLGISHGVMDEIGNGVDGTAAAIPVDGYADKNNLRYALTAWAVSLISTEDPYKTPLNLYLIGNMEGEGFRLNDTEVLTAKELSQYLDESEALINARLESESGSENNRTDSGQGFPVTIVLEGAQSEQWMEQIAGEGRIVLTSSSAAPIDQGGYAGYDNLGESSFSRYFYQFINYGSDIETSFAEANYEILKFYRHTQRPVMDADGNGVGTTKYDRYEASGKLLEYRPSGNLRPIIRTTHPDMTVQTGRSKNIWAIATDPETALQGVFCSVTDPSGYVKTIELSHRDGEMYLENFNAGSRIGCHQLVYYAKDKAGNVSLPMEKFINVISSSPVPSILELPEMTITIQENLVTISWTDVADVDGYTLFYAPYPDASYIGEIDMGNLKTITFDGKGLAFYGAVRAFNGERMSELSNIEYFDLRG